MAVGAADSTADMYAEAEAVIGHMVSVFSEKADLEAVRYSRRTIAELQSLTKARHEEMLQSVKELSRHYERLQTQHKARQASMEGSTEKEQLLGERTQIEQNISRMRQETLDLKKQIGSMESRTTELSAREQHVRQQEAVEVPRARHTISLYANISSIRWDYSSDRVKGFLTSSQGSGIKAFELDPTQHSSYHITNSLWEMMDA